MPRMTGATHCTGGDQGPTYEPAPHPTVARRARGAAKHYVALTKPRIIELLLVTTVPAMVLAAEGWPPSLLVGAVLIGGTLSAGGAHAWNMLLERDLDAAMARTRRRPLPAGELTARQVGVFAAALTLAGPALLWTVAGWLPAVVTAAGAAWYVAVYTAWLKRRTPQNIVVGGAAGAVPPLAGWAAVTGELGAPAGLLFAIVVLWTPPHFWALAIACQRDYTAADVPMLPVTAGVTVTARRSLWYAVATALAALALPLLSDPVGWVYTAIAAFAGAWFVWLAWRVVGRPAPATAHRLFHGSIAYLTIIFVALVADVFLGG